MTIPNPSRVVPLRALRWLAWLALAACLPAVASDWPCYRGPGHDGVSTDPILSSFPDAGPPMVWQVTLDPGFSSFAVSGGKVFTQVRRTINSQSREVCVALSAATGAELWATPVDLADYPDGQAGSDDGPRSTPTVDGNAVYVLSSYLTLAKLDAARGTVLWQQDLRALYGGQVIAWQNAASPLLDGDYLYVNCNSPANCLLALRKTDGGLAWRRGADSLTHATPVAATIAGARQIVFYTQQGLVSVDPSSGDELWRYDFPASTTSAAVSPVVDGDRVYCSAGYLRYVTAAVQISQSGNQFVVTELWRNSQQNYWSTPVCSEGNLYGLFGSYGSASLKCIDLATGNERWAQPGFGSGGILLVDGKLLVTDNLGNVVLVETYPRAYSELGRFGAVAGKCWNTPAVANGRLYLRSTTQAAAFNLSSQTEPPQLTLSLQRLDGSQLRLRVAAVDGSDIDSSRLPGIQVRASAALTAPLGTWLALTNSLTLTNGVIEMDLAPGGSARYLIVTEGL